MCTRGLRFFVPPGVTRIRFTVRHAALAPLVLAAGRDSFTASQRPRGIVSVPPGRAGRDRRHLRPRYGRSLTSYGRSPLPAHRGSAPARQDLPGPRRGDQARGRPRGALRFPSSAAIRPETIAGDRVGSDRPRARRPRPICRLSADPAQVAAAAVRAQLLLELGRRSDRPAFLDHPLGTSGSLSLFRQKARRDVTISRLEGAPRAAAMRGAALSGTRAMPSACASASPYLAQQQHLLGAFVAFAGLGGAVAARTEEDDEARIGNSQGYRNRPTEIGTPASHRA